MNVEDILKRREAITYLISFEESRVEDVILRWCEQRDPPCPLYRWSCTRGMERLMGGLVEPVKIADDRQGRAALPAPLVGVLRHIVHACQEEGVFLLKDVHQHFGGPRGQNPAATMTIRALRDAFYELREQGQPKKIVLLAPEAIIPPDLEKELRVEDFPLPGREELAAEVRELLRRAQAIHDQDPAFLYEVREPDSFATSMVNAAVGLTKVEAEYIFANMLYADRRLTDEAPSRVIREKRQIIRKSGTLEFIPLEELRDLRVGGL